MSLEGGKKNSHRTLKRGNVRECISVCVWFIGQGGALRLSGFVLKWKYFRPIFGHGGALWALISDSIEEVSSSLILYLLDTHKGVCEILESIVNPFVKPLLIVKSDFSFVDVTQIWEKLVKITCVSVACGFAHLDFIRCIFLFLSWFIIGGIPHIFSKHLWTFKLLFFTFYKLCASTKIRRYRTEESGVRAVP